jgi:hypothetical protein
MIKFPHLLSVLLLTTVVINASAQKHSFNPVVDANGNPVANSKYLHIKGSPFIFDEWLPGEVVTKAGEIHKGMLLKYNIENNLLTFVYDPKDEPLKFAEPITAFTIFAEKKMSFANNFPKFEGNGKDSYYEVVAQGKTMLLKHYKRFLKEMTSSELSKTDAAYVQTATYYIFKKGQMAVIKPDAKSVQKILADKSTQIDSFLVAKNITFENEEDLKKVVDFYNTL